MKAVIQRVEKAELCIDGEVKGKIGKGLVVFLGVKEGDSEKEALYLADRCAGIRIFEDEAGKMNLSIQDVQGEIMIISNFTLCADCKKRRPSFSAAARPDLANRLYEEFIDECKKRIEIVRTGVFGADMKITAVNDGPVTIILDTEELRGSNLKNIE